MTFVKENRQFKITPLQSRNCVDVVHMYVAAEFKEPTIFNSLGKIL